MTERLYYTDSYLREFDATIVEAGETGGRPYVVLDRSAFYPSSGGQPFDTGTLGERRVVEVIDREDDGAVVHVLNGTLTGGAEASPAQLSSPVRGLIDWPRRFDHMQHHTGQHVLSAAFLRTSNLPTVSFHLGTDVCTIDLAGVADADAVTRAEDQANQVVWENRPVTVRFVSEEEAARLPLRKTPVRGGTLRIVEVEDFDLSACGGTHVPRTGVIGAIAVQGWEKYKGGTRVSFLCGGRVVSKFRDYRDVVGATVRQLSIQPGELPAAVVRLQADSRDARQQIKALGEALSGYEAADLARTTEPIGDSLVVCRVIEGRDVNGLKSLAQAVASRPRHVAVLISRSRPAQVVVARALDAGVDAAAVLRALIGQFGGRGGGKPDAAQGGGLDGDPDAIRAVAFSLLSDGARS
jgi:alanyl-tRNA synthetase